MSYLSCFRLPSRQAPEPGLQSLAPRLIVFDSRPQSQDMLRKSAHRSIGRPPFVNVQNMDPLGTSVIRNLSQVGLISRQAILSPEVPLPLVTSHAVQAQPRVRFAPSQHQPSFARPEKHHRTPYPSEPDGRDSQDISRNKDVPCKRLRVGPVVNHSKIISNCPPFSVASKPPMRAKFEPYAEWLTSHLYDIVANSAFTQYSDWALQMEKILDILDYYRPKSAVIFLSLYYLSHLFPRGTMASYCFTGAAAVELVARIFLLGLFLAGRWLDDFFYHKNSSWKRFCSLLCASVNELQKAALVVLDYNLTVSNDEWETWIQVLVDARPSKIFARAGRANLVAALCDVLAVARSTHGGETFGVKQSPSLNRLDDLHCRMLEGLCDFDDVLDQRAGFETSPSRDGSKKKDSLPQAPSSNSTVVTK